MKRRVGSKDFGSHVIGYESTLAEDQVTALLELVHRPAGRARSVLGGRSSVTTGEIPRIGVVAVKHFTRGGLLSYLVSRRYLRLGRVRSHTEFRLMNQVRDLGVKTPEPIAYIYQGTLLYRTWLVTREISNHRTLAELSLEDSERAEHLMTELVRQVQLLIENEIFHIDLHPGNVLVDQNDEVYLVDFDKACSYSGALRQLRDKYLTRWRRAVIKHELPEVMSELMCAGLRRHYG